MPLALGNNIPGCKYMILTSTKALPLFDGMARCTFVFLQGAFTMEEVSALASALEGSHFPPFVSDFFKNPMHVDSFGFSYQSNAPPPMLKYVLDYFDERAFTDAYTFHVVKHALRDWTRLQSNNNL